MRILVVGAGAIGGYFGGRLLEGGRDVTFLVRERRAAQLAKTGLMIRGKSGDFDLAKPPVVTAETFREPFDLVLLSCKAYDLAGAIQSFAPAVGAQTAILPLLNGMAHMDALSARFGSGAVLGGQCQISTTLDADGRILHLSDFHALSFGETDGATTERAQAIATAFTGLRLDSRLSTAILQEMWEKWVLIASVAGITCLMRATVGDIVAARAADLATALLDECAAIATARGFAPSGAFRERAKTLLTTPKSTFAASMLRDMEHGARIEADHIIGDLLQRSAGTGRDYPLLRIVYAHLKAYEARCQREAAAKPA